VTYVGAHHSLSDNLAVVGLFFGMALVERFPVPVEGVDAGGVTLGLVFAVASVVLFGWQAGIFVAAGGATLTHLIGHRPPLRVAYNGAMFALSATISGLAIEPIHGNSVPALIGRLALCSFLYNWVVNL